MPPKKQPAVPLGLANEDIPLQCLLCPKKPTFSDVSHLLTHISSKSHLSNRFKTEIRSNKERDARETLRQFDDWYTHYGIQGLLADRMSAKDKKNMPKRSRAQAQVSKSQPSYEDDVVIKPDPEPLSRRSTNESLHAHSARYDSSVDASPYETPVPRQLRRLYPAIGTPGRQSESASVAPSVASEYEATEALADVADGDADRAKLKGIFWPGMSLFDSATPDQKRKRNQRKDVKVVRNMEQVAAGVEPIECIWSEDISLQRTRDIYATPSPVGSPEPEGEEEAPPPKKKRARRSTAATAQPRPRRVSDRLSRAKKGSKPSDGLNSYVLDAEVQRNDESNASPTSNLDEERMASPALKSEGDSFDIFRDPPALSPPGPPGTESSSNAMKFEPGSRLPLQQMSTNIAVSSPTNDFKRTATLRRGQSDFGLQSESSAGGHYFPQHHGLPDSYNPIFGADHRHRLSYATPHPGSQSFDGRNVFHPINGLPYDHNPYELSHSANFFPAAGGYTDTNGFNI